MNPTFEIDLSGPPTAAEGLRRDAPHRVLSCSAMRGRAVLSLEVLSLEVLSLELLSLEVLSLEVLSLEVLSLERLSPGGVQERDGSRDSG